MKFNHAETRELMDKYRAKAKSIHENNLITINDWGGIQLTENGAFVEAVVWVSKEELDESDQINLAT